MRKLAILVALLAAGCSNPSSDAGSPDVDRDAIMGMGYDPGQIRAGQHALYGITSARTAEPVYMKIQVTEQEGDRQWVEQIMPPRVPGERPCVIKSRIDRAGTVHDVWIGEPGGVPAHVYPPADGRRADPPKGPGDARADSTVTDESITVAGRQWACKKVTTRLAYAGGKTTTMINWCHPDVPFGGREGYGGIVKRVFGAYTMELTSHGQAGARAELQIPKK